MDGDFEDDGPELPSAQERRPAAALTAPPSAQHLNESGSSRAPGAPRPGLRAAQPNQLLQAARACLRRGRTRDAAILMELACDLAPLDVRCQALLAWLRMQRGEARPAAVGESLLELLTRAARLHPSDLELRIYRAHALRRLGREAEALSDFAWVASADPCNAEAANELRRHPLRSSDSAPAARVFSPSPATRSTLPPPLPGITRGGAAAAGAPASRSVRAPAGRTSWAPDRSAPPKSGFSRARALRRSG